MYTRSYVVLAKMMFAEHHMVIIPGLLRKSALQSYLECMQLNFSDEHWVRGDMSKHSWRESPQIRVEHWDRELHFGLLSKILDAPIRHSTGWFNVQEMGQYISAHRDAGGDAHLLIGISVPELSAGGQLWLERKDLLVPVGSGDAILFRAADVLHGTTPIRDKHRRRITLNIRLWTKGAGLPT
jgi:hypothetical protein